MRTRQRRKLFNGSNSPERLSKMNWWMYMKCREEQKQKVVSEVELHKQCILARYDFSDSPTSTVSSECDPEGWKKDELCSYLKLMNMNHQKQPEVEDELSKQRRSMRVKNQLISNIKKQLADKLNCDNTFEWPEFPHTEVGNERVNFDGAIKEILTESKVQPLRRRTFVKVLNGKRYICNRRYRRIPPTSLRIFVKPKVKVKRCKEKEKIVVAAKGEKVTVWDHDYNLSPVVDTTNGVVVDDDERMRKDCLNGFVNGKMPECKPVDRSSARSLHSNLLRRRRHLKKSNLAGVFERSPHMIKVFEDDGQVLNCIYYSNYLAVVQTYSVSFWSQSALGLVLEAQNMWVPRGNISRLPLDSVCLLVGGSRESVFATEGSYAYVELYTKEHKSDKRERPVTDVFIVVYFWRERQKEPEKKLLQLENIASYAEHVRYVAVKNVGTVLVSWQEVTVGSEKPVTKLRAYQLSSDFQTVCGVRELESAADCRIESLHNIEDCDDLVMGCGDQTIIVWNWEFGYMVATVRIDDGILAEPSTQWVKCDQGFLFMVQHCRNSGVLRLLAVNGINESWKRLQVYKPITGFDKLLGICMDGGILVGFYENGVLCWRVQTGDLIMDETNDETIKYLPSGKHVVAYTAFSQRITVRSALSYLITNYDSSTQGFDSSPS